jgi:NAD(P)-dependent dehydrogenase (short-subunit alcohol dehydrogenase family)
MDGCSFEGRVAVVTGAGRGIGRAHARLLGELGASVVVNDLGGSMAGSGADAGPAAEVVDEILAAGGTAVADTSDVSQESGASTLIATAVEQFGRIDAVVNNAGIIRWASFPDADVENLDSHLAVHVGGSFHTTRAAWPHFAAVVGMTRSLATAGAQHGIRCNLVAPAAFTRMAGTAADESPMATTMAPELVAPMVAFLAHENCPVTGEIYSAGAGRFARIFIAQAEGYVDATGAPTVDDVAAHWSEINDDSTYTIPADLMAWSNAFMTHLS